MTLRSAVCYWLLFSLIVVGLSAGFDQYLKNRQVSQYCVVTIYANGQPSRQWDSRTVPVYLPQSNVWHFTATTGEDIQVAGCISVEPASYVRHARSR